MTEVQVELARLSKLQVELTKLVLRNALTESKLDLLTKDIRLAVARSGLRDALSMLENESEESEEHDE